MMPNQIAGLDAIHQIAWSATDAGVVDWLNQEWYDYTSRRRPSRATSQSLQRQWLAAIHRDDRQPSRRALRDGISSGDAFNFELRLERADGTAAWFRADVAPLNDARGSAKRWIGICTDIDEYKRMRQRFAFIAKAGEMLAESLDLQAILNRLLGIIVPEFADWALIDLFDEHDRLKTVAVIHADKGQMRLLKRLAGRYNHNPRAEPIIAAILRKNRTILWREVNDKQISGAAAPGIVTVIRELGPRSGVTVPLRARRRTVGSLVACWAKTPHRYEAEDLPLLEELTKRAAISIENARLYEREREIAAELQRAALPISLPEVAGIRLSGIYAPANDRDLLGGDWYDALRLGDGRVVVSIGDVAGSGLPAAVIMSSMRQVIRGVAQVHADPIAMLDAADRTLKMEYPDTLVSAFVGVFDPVARTLTYASAGHPCPLLRDAGGAVTVLGTSGMPLGLRVRDEAATTTALQSGSFVVFYSDGLVKAEHDIARDYDRLVELIARPEIVKSSNPADALYRAILRHGNTDDVVVLTLRLGASAEKAGRAKRGGRRGRWTFDSDDAAAARGSRHSFVAALRRRGVRGQHLDAAELVFGELLGNVARYAPGPVEIIFDWSQGAPVLHVLDRGPGFTLAPKLPSDLLSERGRGLYIVWLLAEDFNVTERYDGGSHARAVLSTTGASALTG
jgi:anti-sigma regulatory factor (Ser/Thr protein kinase)